VWLEHQSGICCKSFYIYCIAEVPKRLCVPTPAKRGEAQVVYMRDICFQQNMGIRSNIYFGRHFACIECEASIIL
jgi:hypothetical protein